MEPEEVIKLNVGGTPYTTTKSTLVKCGYFRRMFDGTMTKAAECEGLPFIDRNGRYFKYVLENLRSGDIPNPEDLSRATIRKINLEFDFFGLQQIDPHEPNPDEDKSNPDEVIPKPFWYNFLYKKIRKEMIKGGKDSAFSIYFNDTDQRQKIMIEDLERRSVRATIAESIRKDLNRENDEVWSHMNDKAWLVEQLRLKPGWHMGKWDTPQEEIKNLASVWQDLMHLDDLDNHEYEDQAPDYRWTREEKMPMIRHIILAEIHSKKGKFSKMPVVFVDESF